MNIFLKAYCRVYQKVMWAAIPILPYRMASVRTSVYAIPLVMRHHRNKRALIVTDPGIVKVGLLTRLIEALDEYEIPYSIYDRVVPNPTIDNVEEARAMYIADGCDVLIGLGGGSAIDCAKVVGARIAQPFMSVSAMGGILRVWRRTPTLFAVPTTAGTGSETTLAAVILDAKKHHKYPINSFPLIPRYAILDGKLTTSLPPHITSTTGMDALTHAVEAYIGGSTTRLTRHLSIETVELIAKYLYTAYSEPDNLRARRMMLLAAYSAGASFTRSYVGYVHAVAHSLGGKYGTPHGLANAVLLPIVLRLYGKAAEPKLADLARKAGVFGAEAVAGKSDHEVATMFIDWIQEMNDRMGIPRKFDFIREEDIDEMVAHAAAEGNPLYPVPVLMDRHELKQIYHLVMQK